LIVDKQARQILVCNSAAEELTGYSREELSAIEFKDLFLSGDPRIQALSSILGESESTTEIEELNLLLRKKSGRGIPVNINIKTNLTLNPQVCICSISDLTKVRDLELEREDILKKVTYASKLA